MANRRKPTKEPLDPTTVTNSAIDAGVRAVEMSTAVARGLAKGALTAARVMTESLTQAAEATTRAAGDLAHAASDGAKRVTSRPTPEPRRAPRKAQAAPRKTQGRRRRAT
jgi:hypothetical protein